MEGKDLRKAGLKVTLPRLKILEILERSSTRHLSAEDIYRQPARVERGHRACNRVPGADSVRGGEPRHAPPL